MKAPETAAPLSWQSVAPPLIFCNSYGHGGTYEEQSLEDLQTKVPPDQQLAALLDSFRSWQP